jgi:SAM-dependent methyltransferase
MSNHNTDTVTAFDRDVTDRGGYQYTTDAPLSSRIANERLTLATLSAMDFSGKSVVDVGCGDGTYTLDIIDRGGASYVLGIDPAGQAIASAQEKVATRPIRFQVGDAYRLPAADSEFDIAHLHGVLHHMERPEEAVREALRVARAVVIIEPNGYSPVLKLLERCSRYHREHEERSYRARTIARWVRNAGGEVVRTRFVGLVPFFCPSSVARCLKAIEPLFESLIGLDRLSCAVAVLSVRRAAAEPSDAPPGAHGRPG